MLNVFAGAGAGTALPIASGVELRGSPSFAAGRAPSHPMRSNAATQAKFLSALRPTNKTLGSGTFGVVKLFVDRVTGENRAVKCMQITDSHVAKDWEREELTMQIMAEAASPSAEYTVQLFSSWMGAAPSKRTGVFVMEACDRSVLDDIRRRAPAVTPLLVALRWAAQMMEGLALLHSLDLLHRDIKPNNVLLQGPGDTAVVKIADMGSSCRSAPLMTAASQTLPYRSPEILMAAEIVEAGPNCVFSRAWRRQPTETASQPCNRGHSQPMARGLANTPNNQRSIVNQAASFTSLMFCANAWRPAAARRFGYPNASGMTRPRMCGALPWSPTTSSPVALCLAGRLLNTNF